MSIYIGSNRYKAMVGSSRADFVTKKALPYDAEVEYLRNTGKTQYIDTGIVAGTGFKIQTIFTSREQARDKWALASYSSNGRMYVIYQYPQGKFGGGYGGYFSGTASMATNTTYDLVVEYTASAQIITLDGVQASSFTKTSNYTKGTNTLWLFGYNGGNSFNSNNSFECEFGPTKIWLSDVLVRDFIPVRVGTTGYMYDKVSGTLFGNDGTGDFTLGPDKT